MGQDHKLPVESGHLHTEPLQELLFQDAALRGYGQVMYGKADGRSDEILQYYYTACRL
jgi:hypothetical protein